MTIRIGPEICRDFEAAVQREWLETNGLGGFASSTILGLNTRRYHGLLVAATKPPVGRFVLLSKLEETLVIGDRRFELSANRYPGVVHPQGYQYLTEFRLDPFPVFTYVVEGVTVEKSVFLVHGENTTVVEYRVSGNADALEIRPLLAFRDYHHLTYENNAVNAAVDVMTQEESTASATVTPYPGLPALTIAFEQGSLERTGCWYRNFEYDIERERGLDYQEDLFQPFLLRFDLRRRSQVNLIASTERRDIARAPLLREAELQRRGDVDSGSVTGILATAADAFLAARGDEPTILAGYPWFTDWGRDTMIALPGLTLATGRFDAARRILLAYARHVDQGMLPNHFPDSGETPEYNTVDATLWFFEAVRALLEATGDREFVLRNLYGVLAGIVDWHVRGTRYGIRVDEDGLLASGAPGVQLTWMDAKIGDWVVTPRAGKPVEIQALWYNALRVMESLGDSARWAAMASRASDAFREKFWNESAGCLYDGIDGGVPDPSIRPNQIFAVSLPHSMLSPERAARVVDVVERHLWTPCGLRTLSPEAPGYRGRYDGGPLSRDSAYHQGTVWPWLAGPFITAYRKVHGHVPEHWLDGFRAHLSEACLGQISEIFDGDPPHHPRGCMAQAWSVAEVLRAALR